MAKLEPPQFQTQISDGPGRILIAGEAAEHGRMIEFLKKQQHTIINVSSTADSIHAAINERAEVVICDLNLADNAGLEICRAVLDHQQLRSVPIAILGDVHDITGYLRALDAGVSDYITKPVNLKILAARIRSLLRYHRALAELHNAHTELEKRVLLRTQELACANASLKLEVAERMSAERALRETGEQLKQVLEHMDALYLFDDHGQLVMVNQAACEQLGYTRAEVMQLSVHQIMAGARSDTHEKLWHEAGGQRPLLRETTFLRKDGTRFPVETRNGLLQLGSRKVLLCAVRDISLRHMQEEALRASEERYALAAKGANDGLWDWNLKTEELYYSQRWKSMLGYTVEEIGTRAEEWFGRVHPEDIEGLRAEISAHLTGETTHFEREYRLLHKDSSWRWMLGRGIAVRDAHSKPCRLVGSQTDITARKTAELQVQHDAFYDLLTGLPNRALFMDRVRQAMQRAVRSSEYRYAVLFIAINRFDVVNDSLGHRCGDRLLMEIAFRLGSVQRPGDTLARLGGAEFAVLLEEMPRAITAEDEAGRIHNEFGKPFVIAEQEIFVSATIGIVQGTATTTHPEEVLRDADTALRRAKETDKRFAIFHPGMHAKAVSILQLESDLRRALDRSELVLHYQPIVSMDGGVLAGVEALTRWKRSTGIIVPPGEFIQSAEQNRMIMPITAWALHEACSQMHDWLERFPKSGLKFINVNLSSKVFQQPNLVPMIRKTLDDTKLDPAALKLEITETALMDYAESATSVFRLLHDLNIRFVLDDFGTGYASLSYLHRYPLDGLKIDRSFIADMSAGPQQLEIVRTIATLARNLKIEAVAEGVETAEQREHLKKMHCQYAQGFYFSRPVPADEISAMLEKHVHW